MPNLGDLKVKIDVTNIDEAIEKANRLNVLLGEAQAIINSLSQGIEVDVVKTSKL